MNVLSLDQASSEQLHAADEANKLVHMSWVQQQAPGMRVQADDQLTVVDCGMPTDTFNVVCRARLSRESLQHRIIRVVAYFDAAGRPFTWWVGPADRPADLGQILLDAGFKATGSEPGMAADLGPLPAADLAPHGLRIERARTPEQIREFAVVLAGLDP